MRRSTDSVIQNPRLLMIIAIGVVIATEGSVNGQLRSAFGPAEADAKRLSGPPAKIGQHLRQVQSWRRRGRGRRLLRFPCHGHGVAERTARFKLIFGLLP